MKTRTVTEGNAFYEIDEECLLRKQKENTYQHGNGKEKREQKNRREKQKERRIQNQEQIGGNGCGQR